MTYFNDRNEKVTLEPAGRQGGEGAVHSIAGQPDKIAKIYHTQRLVGSELAEKLRVMIANPPDDPMTAHGHLSIAWPESRLFLDGHFVGYVMPRVAQTHQIVEFYNPTIRQQRHPGVTWKNLHAIGRNLAAALAALHARDYVVGDLNEGNIFVNHVSLVTLIDTDSFQIRDPQTGRLFRCQVGKGEFTPAELQGKDLNTADRFVYHDLFSLGVLLFQLLMEGFHPFTGINRYVADVSGMTVYEHNIGQGNFPYDPASSFAPPLAAPEFNTLHPPLQALFRRCFVDGHKTPTARPSALEWHQELQTAEALLRQCEVKPQHWYSPHLSECPWCLREKIISVIAAASKSESITRLNTPLQTPSPQGWGAIPAELPAAKPPASRRPRRSRSELRLEAVAPETVVVNRPFDLVVGVRRPDSSPIQLDVPNQRAAENVKIWDPNSRAKKVPGVDLRVHVHAPECVFVGKAYEMIRLPWGEDSKLLYFTLRPLRAGEIPIRVTLYQAFIMVGSIRLSSHAGGQVAGSAEIHTSILHLPEAIEESNGAYNLLVKTFSIDELETLCEGLGIDFDELPGKIKQRKAGSLVAYAQRHGRVGDLIAAIMVARPNWMELV